MQILVVAATEMEITPMLSVFPNQEILITGVGAPQTILQLCKRFSLADYQAVIQAGIAGSFKNQLQEGEVVAVYKDCFADLGIVEKGRIFDLFETGLASVNDSTVSAGWLTNPDLLGVIDQYKKVAAVTVNMAGNAPELTKLIVEKYQPDIESMEGAAFHFACREFKQPYLQLRSISNRVGERDKSKWQLREAIDHLNVELIHLINHLRAGAAINEAYNDHE